MDVTNDDYIRLLSALLPPGPAWSASDPAIAGAAPLFLPPYFQTGGVS